MSEEKTLRVGRVRGVTPTKWQRVWCDRYDAELTVTDVADDAAVPALHDGSLDMCFVRLPIDRDGLHAIPLYEEQMVAWVSKEHVISAVEDITLADLEDEQIITEFDDVRVDLMLAGVVFVVPMSIAREASRKDLTYRPITDTEPSGIALAWLVENENPLIEDFIGVVRGRTANSSRTISGERNAANDDPRRASGKSSPKPGRAPARGHTATRGAKPGTPRKHTRRGR